MTKARRAMEADIKLIDLIIELRDARVPDSSKNPDIDRLMSDPEYQDVIDRIIITAEPGYLARFTSTNQVIQYQRRFMNAVNNDQKAKK